MCSSVHNYLDRILPKCDYLTKNPHNSGAEMLELDVHLSQDEQVVVAHDQVP